MRTVSFAPYGRKAYIHQLRRRAYFRKALFRTAGWEREPIPHLPQGHSERIQEAHGRIKERHCHLFRWWRSLDRGKNGNFLSRFISEYGRIKIAVYLFHGRFSPLLIV